jgi:hypothetical protein
MLLRIIPRTGAGASSRLAMHNPGIDVRTVQIVFFKESVHITGKVFTDHNQNAEN